MQQQHQAALGCSELLLSCPGQSCSPGARTSKQLTVLLFYRRFSAQDASHDCPPHGLPQPSSGIPDHTGRAPPRARQGLPPISADQGGADRGEQSLSIAIDQSREQSASATQPLKEKRSLPHMCMPHRTLRHFDGAQHPMCL